jgi:O-antigen/teichoic acid export membrane protein
MSGNLARNTFASAIAGLSVMLGGFLSNIIIARLLGVEAVGVVAFAIWAMTVSIVLIDLGTSGTLARYLPELEAGNDRDQAGGLTQYLFRLIAAALLVVCGGFMIYASTLHFGSRGTDEVALGHYSRDPMFWILIGLGSLFQAGANFTTGYLKGKQAFDKLAAFAIMSAVAQVMVTWLGAEFWGADGALIGWIALGIVPTVLLPSILGQKGRLSLSLRQRATRYTLESWISYLGSAFAWSRMEIFFLERSVGSHSVALFAVGLTLANLATQGPMLLTGGLLPYLAAQSGKDARHRIMEAYALGLRLLALLVFPACFGLAAVAPTLLPLIYGQDFAAAVPSATILLAGTAFAATSSVATTYLFAMERTRFVLWTGSVSAVLVVIAGLTVIPWFGPVGAAAARVVIQISVLIVTAWYIERVLHAPTPFVSLARITIAALICAIVARGVTLFLPSAQALPLAIAAGMFTFAISIRAMRALPAADGDRLLNAVATLPRFLHIPTRWVVRFISPP